MLIEPKMAGKKATNSGSGNAAVVPVMSNTRRRSSARKNKAFQMLQRDMEQVTCGRKKFGQELCYIFLVHAGGVRFRFVGFREFLI